MRIPGVVVGIVRDVADPLGQGRLQLEFPWLTEEHTSAWAPVAAPMAGNRRGAFFMPEVDDEVLVAFERGDFQFPYVVGFLWNGVDLPPETETTNRVIVTPGGHTLRFEDTAGAGKVVLQSQGGHQVVLDDSPGSVGVTVRTAGGLSLKMDDLQQSIELSGGGRTVAMRGGSFQIT